MVLIVLVYSKRLLIFTRMLWLHCVGVLEKGKYLVDVHTFTH